MSRQPAPPPSPKPLVGDASDAEQVREAKDWDQRRRQRELRDFADVLATEAGRRFVYRLLDVAGIYRSSFTGNSTTFFNEGMRQVGLVFLADLNEQFPERLLEIMQEAKERAALARP